MLVVGYHGRCCLKHTVSQAGQSFGGPLALWGVVELGQQKGVPTPLNRAIADILNLHAKGAQAPT